VEHTGADTDTAFSALIVDDDPSIRQSLRLCLEAEGARVLGVGGVDAALEALERSVFDVILLDVWLRDRSGIDALPQLIERAPDTGVIVVTAFATFESAVEAMRRGAADYLPKPFTPEQVRVAVRRCLERRPSRRPAAEPEERPDAGDAEAPFATASPAFRACLETALRAAGSTCAILLRGESGTGKSAVARWIHDHSPRQFAAFAAANCRGLSDLSDKVQEAAGGTLFLDEVGELGAEAQAHLVALLDDGDVRLLASTSRDLDEDVRAGRFRDDLLHRLNVVTLTLPPLRERVEDVVPLARHYLQSAARRQRRGVLRLAPRAEEALKAHRWPGNLRELRNAVERAAVLSPTSLLEPEDLGLANRPPGDAAEVALGAPVTLEDLEREHIARVILHSPTLEAAARTLGIDATTLHRKRKRYGLV
jgi:NtrC-family two-component system response regulator AlgB